MKGTLERRGVAEDAKSEQRRRACRVHGVVDEHQETSGAPCG